MSQALSDAPKFVHWKKQLEKNGLTIHSIEEKYTRYTHDGDALFSLLYLDATTPEGDKIPPICFLKGSVISALVCLIDRDSGEKHLLLVRQRRICNGGLIYEHVAGMVDGSDSPREVALREVREEAGIDVPEDALHALNEEPYFPSTGTSDEALYFFFAELEMSREEIMTHNNKETGLIHEHERITTHLASIAEAKRLITNCNGLLNIYLYEESRESR